MSGNPPSQGPRVPIDTGDHFRPDLLAGRVALVTGGGTGIGQVMALGLARAGARVVIAGRTEERLRDATEAMIAEGLAVSWKRLDIRDDARVEAVVGEVEAELGGIDVLVNNAGGQFLARAEAVTAKGWRSVVDLNLNGTFYVTSAVGRGMIARGRGGKVINVIASFIHGASPGNLHSGAARAGVAQMTRTLAVEWAPHGIQVNAIGPQYLSETARANYPPAWEEWIRSVTPAGRWARSDEIAGWAVILAGPLSDYTTGDLIWLDGGQSLSGGLNYLGSEPLAQAEAVGRARRGA